MKTDRSHAQPARGDVWMVNLDPTLGREQAGQRPALVVSVNEVNSGPSDLTIIVPITGTDRGIVTHVRITPPEGGLDRPSVIMMEQVRAVSRARLVRRRGSVSTKTMRAVEDGLRVLLGF